MCYELQAANPKNSAPKKTDDDWRLDPVKLPKDKDPLAKLMQNMRITAHCRYQAYKRLKRHSEIAFFTTTLLSLCLIFIPLMQNADLVLQITPKVLNMMQVFLAVLVLVYSVYIGTTRLDLRAKELNDSADRIKSLVRDMEHAIKTDKAAADKHYEEYQRQYSDRQADSENHEDVDFYRAQLELHDDYQFGWLARINYWRKIHINLANVRFIIPIVMIAAVMIFIAYMLIPVK
jgi:hypothetical protein